MRPSRRQRLNATRQRNHPVNVSTYGLALKEPWLRIFVKDYDKPALPCAEILRRWRARARCGLDQSKVVSAKQSTRLERGASDLPAPKIVHTLGNGSSNIKLGSGKFGGGRLEKLPRSCMYLTYSTGE